MTEILKEIRRAVDTGSVAFGFRQTEKNILKSKAKIVIISNNCPRVQSEKMRHYTATAQIPLFEFEGTGLQLGFVCGKPFLVSTLCILNEGKSKIIDAVHSPGSRKAKPKKAKPARKTVPKKAKAKTKKVFQKKRKK